MWVYLNPLGPFLELPWIAKNQQSLTKAKTKKIDRSIIIYQTFLLTASNVGDSSPGQKGLISCAWPYSICYRGFLYIYVVFV